MMLMAIDMVEMTWFSMPRTETSGDRAHCIARQAQSPGYPTNTTPQSLYRLLHLIQSRAWDTISKLAGSRRDEAKISSINRSLSDRRRLCTDTPSVKHIA